MATTKKAAEAATGEAQSLTFNERVIALQNELKAPKSKYNSFGKYAYRSCEDILEAVKPLLAKHGLRLNISDQVIYFGNGDQGRFYVKATTALTDGESWLTSEGWAREEETKKGMDGSQITGTASSYARKYALNGLLLIDDTKDADTDEFHNVTNQPAKKATSQPATTIFPPDNGEIEAAAIQDVKNCQSSLELTAVWNKYKSLYPEITKAGGKFYDAVAVRGGALKKEGK